MGRGTVRSETEEDRTHLVGRRLTSGQAQLTLESLLPLGFVYVSMNLKAVDLLCLVLNFS